MSEWSGGVEDEEVESGEETGRQFNLWWCWRVTAPLQTGSCWNRRRREKKGGGRRRRTSRSREKPEQSVGASQSSVRLVIFPRRSDFLFVVLLLINNFYFGIVHFLSGVSWLQFLS